MTPVVLLTGLSGAGKASTLRVLEDLGYEAVDNPPLTLVDDLARRAGRPIAIGLDARTRGFNADEVLHTWDVLRADPEIAVQLVYATADPAVLLQRFTETRRRHPLAAEGRVVDGIAREIEMLTPLRGAADLVIDTSNLPLPELRRVLEQRFYLRGDADPHTSFSITVMSFAFPAGLPREADMVFDARFLRNPHYDPILRPRTGLDTEVADYVETDPDFSRFFDAVLGLVTIVLPRFVHEGKKYATIAIGCTGGRHRSVRIAERLAAVLQQVRPDEWQVSTVHRELTRASSAGKV